MELIEIEVIEPYKQIQALFRMEDGAKFRRVYSPGADLSDAPLEVVTAAQDWSPDLISEYHALGDQI